MGLVDAKLVGGLGPSALGGVGLATVMSYVAYAIAYGGSRGVKVAVAHAVGEGRLMDVGAYTRAGALLGAGWGALMLLALRAPEPLLRAFGTDESLVAPAATFLVWVTLAAPFTCLGQSLVQARQALGDTRSPMIVAIGANVVNAALAYALIGGHWGAPSLGVKGAAIATAAAQIASGLAMIAVTLADERTRATPRVRPIAAARAVVQLGAPTGAQFMLETLAFTAFTAILGTIGAVDLAAHQLALAVIRVSYLPAVALSEAGCVLVGQALGARDLDGADALARTTLRLGLAFMSACGLAFALLGRPIARAFTADPELVSVATRVLVVAAVFQTADAASIILRGLLRGAKDVRAVAWITSVIAWVTIPSAAWVLGRVLGWGVLGGWVGFVLETSLAATILYARWRWGGWRSAYARNDA